MDIKKEYDVFVKKYKLPSYEGLDKEFELLYFQNVIEIKYPLRFVRRRILDKINWFLGFLQGLIQPNPGSLISLEESRFFTQEEKDKVVALIKKLIILQREGLLLDIDSDEKKDSEFIKEAFDKWMKHKKEIFSINVKIKEGWESEVKEERGQYFG